MALCKHDKREMSRASLLPPFLPLSFHVHVQLRELRLEVEDLHNSRVQEEVISRSESRVKELENALRVEERSVTSQNPE